MMKKMNNIYVDELPDCCVYCSLCCSDYKGKLYCKQLDENFKENIEIVNYKERKSNCPLIPITDRLAEERKKVVSEIWQEFEQRLKGKTKDMSIIQVCLMINSVLDQVERGDL